MLTRIKWKEKNDHHHFFFLFYPNWIIFEQVTITIVDCLGLFFGWKVRKKTKIQLKKSFRFFFDCFFVVFENYFSFFSTDDDWRRMVILLMVVFLLLFLDLIKFFFWLLNSVFFVCSTIHQSRYMRVFSVFMWKKIQSKWSDIRHPLTDGQIIIQMFHCIALDFF